jgi:hypothetical protein
MIYDTNNYGNLGDFFEMFDGWGYNPLCILHVWALVYIPLCSFYYLFFLRCFQFGGAWCYFLTLVYTAAFPRAFFVD